jgi:hypothetical protein
LVLLHFKSKCAIPDHISQANILLSLREAGHALMHITCADTEKHARRSRSRSRYIYFSNASEDTITVACTVICTPMRMHIYSIHTHMHTHALYGRAHTQTCLRIYTNMNHEYMHIYVVHAHMRSMRSMRGGFIFRNRGGTSRSVSLKHDQA